MSILVKHMWRHVVHSKTPHTHTRQLSSRAQRVLSALDLPTDNQLIPGLFDGQWSGKGDVLESRCPATGEVIGRVQGVRLFPRYSRSDGKRLQARRPG